MADDLTTAYQVCDNIVVLYQGSVTEAGSVERVIRDPKHPYTQILVFSIPQTDRSKRWGSDEIPTAEAVAGRMAKRLPLRTALRLGDGRMLEPDPAATPTSVG